MSLATIIAALVANQLGAIAPDIDQPTAPLWRNVSFGKLFGRFFGRIMGGHRFLTHSLIGVALLGFVVNWLLVFIHPLFPSVDSTIVWWAFMIGMLSHLVMDSFTKEGVPWLLPVPIKFGFPPLRRFRITTGRAIENFFVVPLLIVIVIAICAVTYPELLQLVQDRVVE